MFISSDPEQNRRQRRAADVARVRAHNASLLLNLVWEADGVSRADLARRSGLSRSTVSDIISELIERRLINESHTAPSTGGRPPIVLRFADERFSIIGVEMGSSHVTVALMNLRGKPRVVFHRDHDIQNDPFGAVRLIESFIERCLDSTDADPNAIIGVGVAVPCPIDPRFPDRLSPRILPRWEGIRLTKRLSENLSLPVFIDNDANLGALAERWWGAGQDVRNFAYIKVATGVGSGLIIDGEIFRGAAGIAGEIGHTAMVKDGPKCRCGLSGCLESLIGTEALLKQLKDRLRGRSDSPLEAFVEPRLGDLVEAARTGDPIARQIIGNAGRQLGIAIANLLNIFNPARVILGGSLTRAGDILCEPLVRAVQSRAMWDAITDTEIRITGLGEEAIAVGAATQVLAAALQDPALFPGARARSA
ncbi:MAG: ROK family transcriptional regulator [Myxococcota bacterium]